MSTAHLFTNDEYHRLFSEGDRVELVEGVVYDKMVIGPRHNFAVSELQRIFIEAGCKLNSQGPIAWPGNEPEPDLVLVTEKHPDRHPLPSEVLLLVEVSDSTLEYDRNVKLPAYEAAGIRSWIVNLRDNCFEVDGERLTEVSFEGVTIRIEEIT